MTSFGPGHPVRCPYCLDPLVLDPGAVFLPNKLGGQDPIDLAREPNPIRREELLRNAFQRCPNRSDLPAHSVPVPYLRYGQPLTVAMVGTSQAGKTHLLTAMLADLQRDVLSPFGLTSRAVNSTQHDRVVVGQMQRLEDGGILDSTSTAGNIVTFVDSLLIEGHGRTIPVGFFDVAGEDLISTDRALRFLAGVDALIFVVDPVSALQLPELARARQQAVVSSMGDRTFPAVLDRLPRNGPLIDVPAAMVIAKSDLLRFSPPADRWLVEELRPPLDSDQIEAESRDAFALLHECGGRPWLKPFLQCRRCTLHFASATGGNARDGRYPRGARSRRAVQPLLAILAMKGLLGPHLADVVGA